jgi:2-polyprenyl-3-methyl-5-hydroxy-6-metoxy-1,4-benzoquinol methylase
VTAVSEAVAARARLSLGRGADAIIDTVMRLLAERGAAGTLADIGCGRGDLWRAAQGRFDRCVGVDAVSYEGLPEDIHFVPADFDARTLPISDDEVDVAAALEVVEHLENPRAFVRELVRITRPGGWVVVTTPNQLSALSLLTLVVKGRFAAFQDSEYPAHRTALLEVDLRRIAWECGLQDVLVEYTRHGRVPFTANHFPHAMASLAPRRLSDNLVMIGRR